MSKEVKVVKVLKVGIAECCYLEVKDGTSKKHYMLNCGLKEGRPIYKHLLEEVRSHFGDEIDGIICLSPETKNLTGLSCFLEDKNVPSMVPKSSVPVTSVYPSAPLIAALEELIRLLEQYVIPTAEEIGMIPATPEHFPACYHFTFPEKSLTSLLFGQQSTRTAINEIAIQSNDNGMQITRAKKNTLALLISIAPFNDQHLEVCLTGSSYGHEILSDLYGKHLKVFQVPCSGSISHSQAGQVDYLPNENQILQAAQALALRDLLAEASNCQPHETFEREVKFFDWKWNLKYRRSFSVDKRKHSMYDRIQRIAKALSNAGLDISKSVNEMKIRSICNTYEVQLKEWKKFLCDTLAKAEDTCTLGKVQWDLLVHRCVTSTLPKEHHEELVERVVTLQEINHRRLQFSVRSIRAFLFYKCFTSDVYIITGCGRYENRCLPNEEVIMGIVLAAAKQWKHHQTKCIIQLDDPASVDLLKTDFQKHDFVKIFYLAGKTLQSSTYMSNDRYDFEELTLTSPGNVTKHLSFNITVAPDFTPRPLTYRGKVILKDFIDPYNLPGSLEVSLLLNILAGSENGSKITKRVQKEFSNFSNWTVDCTSSFELNHDKSVRSAELKLDPKEACPNGEMPLKSVTMYIEIVKKDDIKVLLYDNKRQELKISPLPKFPGELYLDGCCTLNTSDTILVMAKKPPSKRLILGDILSFLLTPSCSYLLVNGLPLALSENLITMELDGSKTVFVFDRVKRKVISGSIFPVLSHGSVFIQVGPVGIRIDELKLNLNENYEYSEKNVHLCGNFMVDDHQVTASSTVDIEGLPKITLHFKECSDTATVLNLLHTHENIVSMELPLLKNKLKNIPINGAEVTLVQPARGSTLLTMQSIYFCTQPTKTFDHLKTYLPTKVNILEVKSVGIRIDLGPQSKVCVSSKSTACIGKGKQVLLIVNVATVCAGIGSCTTCNLELETEVKKYPLLSHDLGPVLSDSYGISLEEVSFLKSYAEHIQIHKVSLAQLAEKPNILEKLSIVAHISKFKLGPEIEFMGGFLSINKFEAGFQLNCSGDLQIGPLLTLASIQLPTLATSGYLEVTNHAASFTFPDVCRIFHVTDKCLQGISHLVSLKDNPVVKIKCVLQMQEKMLKILSTEICLHVTEKINFGNIFSIEESTLVLEITPSPAVEVVSLTASGFFTIAKPVIREPSTTVKCKLSHVIYKRENVLGVICDDDFNTTDAVECLQQLFKQGTWVGDSTKAFTHSTKHVKSMLDCAVSEKSLKQHKLGAMYQMRIGFEMNVERITDHGVKRVGLDHLQFEMRDIIRIRQFVIDSFDFHYSSSTSDDTKFQIHAVLTKQNYDECMDLLLKTVKVQGNTTAINAQLLQRNTSKPLTLSSVLQLAVCSCPELPHIGIEIPDFLCLHLKKGEITFSTKKPFEVLAFVVTVIVPCWQLLKIPCITIRDIEFTVLWKKGNKPKLEIQSLFCLAGVHLLFKGFITKDDIKCAAKLPNEVSETELTFTNLIDIKKKILQLPDSQLSDLDIQRMLHQLPHPTEGFRKLIIDLPEAMRSILFQQFILQFEKERKGLLCHILYSTAHKWNFPLGCCTLQMMSLGGVIELWKFLGERSAQYKACLYTQLKVCHLDINVQILLSSNSKNIITGYAEARNESITCSGILCEVPSCDSTTILGQLDQLPFKLSDKISKLSLVVDITKKTLAILGKYEGLASCVLYLQLDKGVTDETQFVLGIDVPKEFKFGKISKALSFLDNKIAVHQAGLLIASLKGSTLTEVMEMFEESVRVLNGVETYSHTKVLECNSKKCIQKLALDGIPNIRIPASADYEIPLTSLKLRETDFWNHTFSKDFVLYGVLDFVNSRGYIQNLNTISVQKIHIPEIMLAMRVVIPNSGEKDRFIHFHGCLKSDFNILHNITLKEAAIDVHIQGEKQVVSLSGTITCDIPSCDALQTVHSKINAKGVLHMWK